MTRHHPTLLSIYMLLALFLLNLIAAGQDGQAASSPPPISAPSKLKNRVPPMGSAIGREKCTYDQIERMIDARFTLEEIYSICNIGKSNRSSSCANKILRKVAETFAGCATYVDQGVQYTKWIRPKRQMETTTFTTAFIRPHRLRFEHAATSTSGPSHAIVYMNGDTVKSKWNQQNLDIKKKQSLTTALVGTGWIGAMIPRLLMPNRVHTWNLLQLDEIEKMSDKLLEGRNYYRIKGYHPMGDVEEPIILWIDKTTYLIRKIEKISKTEKYLIKETIIFDAHMNINLTADRIGFERGPRLTPADFATEIKPKSPANN